MSPSKSCEAATHRLQAVVISSIFPSVLSLLGIFESLGDEQRSWAPLLWHPGSSVTEFCSDTQLATSLTQLPLAPKNKRAFKIEYNSKLTFICCWLNPALPTDILGWGVIYSSHTEKLKEMKGNYFAFFFYYTIWCSIFPGKETSSFNSS